jgi:4-hydroxybenzoate polyprenyltransferase
MNADTRERPTFRDLIRTLRPNQWTKNAVVMAAFFFALGDRSQHLEVAAGLIHALLAAALFCLISSGVYIVNDIMDAPSDRRHPTKRFRPVAAGRVPTTLAAWLAVFLLAVGVGASWLLAPRLAEATAAYVLIQLVYSFGLKRVALVDVFVIAAGFVLRAVAGAFALGVGISPWLLLCAFLLALFLALCKRRHEKILMDGASRESRPGLENYDERLLDQLIAVVASATVVCYSIYTLSSQTIEKFGTARLGFTIPFVMFGLFR